MSNTHTTLASLFTAIADAIRGKTGGTAQIVADHFPTEIAGISTGVDTSDATATASDLASGKTAYVNGKRISGLLPSASSLTYDGFADFTGGKVVLFGSHTYDVIVKKSCSVTVRASGSSFGEAAAADVASGKTFTSSAGLRITGTSTAVATDDANATATDIASGKTAYVNGKKVTGSIPVLMSAEARTYPVLGNRSFGSYFDFYAEVDEAALFQPYSEVHITKSAASFGNATAADVAAGKTFTSAKGLNLTGTSDALSVRMLSGTEWTQSGQKAGAFNIPVELSTGRVVAGSGDNNGIYYSDDHGVTWTQSTKTTGNWRSLIELSTGRLVIGGYSNVGIFYSDNQGATWVQSNQKSGNWFAPIELSTGRLVCGNSNYGAIWYSDDHGTTWIQSGNGDSNWYTPVKLSTGRLVCSSSDNSGICYSDDQGLTWVMSNKTISGWSAPIELSNGRLVCGSMSSNETGIIYSDDKGKTWKSSGKTIGLWNQPIELSNGRIVIGNFYGNPGIWYSDDHGVTWTQGSDMSGSWGTAIELSTGRLMIGGNGILYSDDKGLTWMASSQASLGWLTPIELTNKRLLSEGTSATQGIIYSDPTKIGPDLITTTAANVAAGSRFVGTDGIIRLGTGELRKQFNIVFGEGVWTIPTSAYCGDIVSCYSDLGSLEILDENGNVIPYIRGTPTTRAGGEQYYFIMPNSNITVNK